MPREKQHPSTKRRSRTIPWGYKPNKYDPDILDPIPELCGYLNEAERAWNVGTYSQAMIAAWLTDKAFKAGYKMPITKIGLKKRLTSTARNIKKYRI